MKIIRKYFFKKIKWTCLSFFTGKKIYRVLGNGISKLLIFTIKNAILVVFDEILSKGTI
jgi:hypothetical protein